jgi:hypothetical protein
LIHRFPIPFPDERAWPDLPRWLQHWGWAVTAYEERYEPLHLPRRRFKIALKSYMEPAELVVSSGAILIYDDLERSLGVTSKPEPQDAVPAEPEDARPLTFAEQYADMSLLQDSRPRRRRKGAAG